MWVFGDCPDRELGRSHWVKSGKSVGYRGVVEINFTIILLVGKLRFIDEYRELETVKPGDWEEQLAGAVVEASGAGVVYNVSLFSIFFMFTG